MFDIYKVHTNPPAKIKEEGGSIRRTRCLSIELMTQEKAITTGPVRTYLIAPERKSFCELPEEALKQIRLKKIWKKTQDIDDLRKLIKETFFVRYALWNLRYKGYYFFATHTWESFKDVGLSDQKRPHNDK